MIPYDKYKKLTEQNGRGEKKEKDVKLGPPGVREKKKKWIVL